MEKNTNKKDTKEEEGFLGEDEEIMSEEEEEKLREKLKDFGYL